MFQKEGALCDLEIRKKSMKFGKPQVKQTWVKFPFYLTFLGLFPHQEKGVGFYHLRGLLAD